MTHGKRDSLEVYILSRYIDTCMCVHVRKTEIKVAQNHTLIAYDMLYFLLHSIPLNNDSGHGPLC